jgi:hypothetical protein
VKDLKGKEEERVTLFAACVSMQVIQVVIFNLFCFILLSLRNVTPHFTVRLKRKKVTQMRKSTEATATTLLSTEDSFFFLIFIEVC